MGNLRTFSLVLAAISYIIVIGGAVYEHLAVVPVWVSAVPKSLSMFQGEYGLAAQRFWIPIHPVTLALFALTLLLNWKTGRRWFIAAAFGGYAFILLVTFLYFVPELITLTGTLFAPTVDAELTARARLWGNLSLIRLGVLILLAVTLLFGLSRPSDPRLEEQPPI